MINFKGNQSSKRFRFVIGLVLFFLLCIPMFFYDLDEPTIRMWDESRRAINAFEMSVNHQWFVPHFDGSPEMVGTKPPLLLWLMVTSINFFGYTEFAIRLPSAIFAVGTSLLIFCFCTVYFSSLISGVASGLTLITTAGFYGEHVARTGDYDSLLLFWVTAYALSFFLFLETSKLKFLYIFSLSLSFAMLTKGIAGALAFPGILLYGLACRECRHLVLSKKFYIAFSCAFFPIVFYYFFRDSINPGYIKSVLENEVFGRYGTTLENHKGPANFYLIQIREKFRPWIYILLPSIFISYIDKDERVKKFTLFSTSFLFFYMLIVSFSQTKLPWYDAQMYPMLSILVGLGISKVLKDVISGFMVSGESATSSNRRSKATVFRSVLTIILMFSIFFPPYLNSWYNGIYKNKGILYPWSRESNVELSYGKYLKTLRLEMPSFKKFSIINNDDYNAHLLFYQKVFNRRGYLISTKEPGDKLYRNEKIVVCDFDLKEALFKAHSFDDIHKSGPCSLLNVSEKGVF